jgi:hypothetical protein
VHFFKHIGINAGLKHALGRAEPKTFEIKPFSASMTPITIQLTLQSQIITFSRIISERCPDSIVGTILGAWSAAAELAKPHEESDWMGNKQQTKKGV